MKALADHEVWFVTGSQELCGADVLDVAADHAGRIARALDESPSISVRIVPKPVVTTHESILELCLADIKKELRWNHAFYQLAPGL